MLDYVNKSVGQVDNSVEICEEKKRGTMSAKMLKHVDKSPELLGRPTPPNFFDLCMFSSLYCV
jgi:hypothetical protein